jgi:hypothetical protein
MEITFAEQPQVGLVNEGRGLHGLPGRQMRHAGLRQLAELVVDQGQQSVGRCLVAFLRGAEEGCHFVGGLVHGANNENSCQGRKIILGLMSEGRKTFPTAPVLVAGAVSPFGGPRSPR